MTRTQNFFRKYILSTLRILALFLLVNALLICLFLLIFYLEGASKSQFPIEKFSSLIENNNNQIEAHEDVEAFLKSFDAWAMLLNDNGDVTWECKMPQQLSRHYSATDIALFSRWYLEDYPVNIWKRLDGLLVVGLSPDKVTQFYTSFNKKYFVTGMYIVLAIFLANICLIIFFFLRNIHQIEKAVSPILDSIHSLSDGSSFHLDESGELVEIRAELNRAGKYLIKKDNTRADWIRGISHDIHTPLSMILGYSSEIEDNPDVSETVHNQARIIRTYSEYLKNLVENLNLTTKLEYSMYTIGHNSINPVELARQVIAEFINNNLSDKYELILSEFYEKNHLQIIGDTFLLNRMLTNLIRNSFIHNPNGCHITVSINQDTNFCIFSIEDTGQGVDIYTLEHLNKNGFIRNPDNTEHGLGLKIVNQIVHLHHGKIKFSANKPHGLIVQISLPRDFTSMPRK